VDNIAIGGIWEFGAAALAMDWCVSNVRCQLQVGARVLIWMFGAKLMVPSFIIVL
jgi:hypothetical protein